MKDICVFASVVGLLVEGIYPTGGIHRNCLIAPLCTGGQRAGVRVSGVGLSWSKDPGAGGTAASQRGRYIYKLMKKRKRLKIMKKMNGWKPKQKNVH